MFGFIAILRDDFQRRGFCGLPRFQCGEVSVVVSLIDGFRFCLFGFRFSFF